jgi:hypothetical protein
LSPDETLACNFLVYFGLSPTRYSKKETRTIKTPDFKVGCLNGFFFYCEQKTIDSPNPETATNQDQHQNKLNSHITKAAEQFNTVNKSRIVPNVLIWISKNPRINSDILKNLVEGKLDLFGNVIDLSVHRNRVYSSLAVIDLHIFVIAQLGF